MCGRYYIDDETAKEMEKLVREIDYNMRNSGDIRPSQTAAVIRRDGEHLAGSLMV